MKRQGTGNSHPSEQRPLTGDPGREQGSERFVRVVRSALPPVQDDAGALRDLWPEMQRRLRAGAAPEAAKMHVPWIDWALGLGLAGLLAMFPAWIPVLLYCL